VIVSDVLEVGSAGGPSSKGAAIVTGAGRGFGKAIVKRLAREGYAVALTARTESQISAVAAEIGREGGRAIALTGDVTDRQDVARVVEETERRLGPTTLLINNAGVPGPFGPIWAVNPEEWWASQAVHIRAPLLFLRAVLPGMTQRRAGRVIIVSAKASRLVAANLSAYCVGKIAQTRLVEEVAVETRELGVAAFAIDPGFVFTELAAQTLNSPDAQRWLPGMVARVAEKRADPNAEADLARCAQRCVDLASGRYDRLSGRYFEMSDDLEQALREATGGPGPVGGHQS
jgi:NAD(P)-dependent dehydrogenase (short-subunit alcohol dehydrogenase family)